MTIQIDSKQRSQTQELKTEFEEIEYLQKWTVWD